MSDPVEYLNHLHSTEDKLRAEVERLRAALQMIVSNARVAPDPLMQWATDIYAVPMDDIDAGRAALAAQNAS